MEKIDEYLEKFGFNQLEKVTPLKQLADKLSIKTAYIGFGAIIILIILVVLEIGSFLISNLVGFAYPAYMSFKAIESKDKNDDTLWLTYWTVFAFFTIFDNIFHALLYFIPFFYLIKLVFYIWLFHPQTKGAVFLYDKIIKKHLIKYEAHIDEKIQGLAAKGEQFYEQGKQKFIK